MTRVNFPDHFLIYCSVHREPVHYSKYCSLLIPFCLKNVISAGRFKESMHIEEFASHILSGLASAVWPG